MSGTLSDPAAFVRHVVDAHGMNEGGVWMNLPTTRAYHDWLHTARADRQDHQHQPPETVTQDA